MDQSLDEIINQQRQNKARTGGNRAARAANRAAGGRAGNRGASGINLGARARQALNTTPVRSGVVKVGSNRRITLGTPSPIRTVTASGLLRQGTRPFVNRAQRAAAGNVDGVWTHDLFEGGNQVANTAVPAGGFTSAAARNQSNSRVSIKNLHHNVVVDDILNICANYCGSVKNAHIVYDRSGRSTGEAIVVFHNSADALNAVKLLNGVPLDDKPMIVSLASTARFGSAGAQAVTRSGLVQPTAARGRFQGNTRRAGRAMMDAPLDDFIIHA